MSGPRPAPLRERVVSLAAGQLGLREKGGPNQGPPVERFAGGRTEPWCAHFVAWLFRHCGRPLPGDIEPHLGQHNPIARVKTMWDCLVTDHMQVLVPSPGDIVVFGSRMASDAGKGWHVGIVESVDDERFQDIEGNTGDSVARQRYRLDDKRIIGYARVPE